MEGNKMNRSKLQPPPKTHLMTGSQMSSNDLGRSKIYVSIRPEIKKSSILSKRDINK
jgi:hypothetical protein